MLWTTPENVENFERKKLSELGKELEYNWDNKINKCLF